MRTIKFRVWDGEQMVSPDYIDRNGIGYWKEHSIPRESDIGDLMQFTGLLDKNGKEVYEGDVVTWRHLNSVNYEVYYNQDECHYFAKPSNKEIESYLDSTHMEVIGNIHENSELLN